MPRAHRHYLPGHIWHITHRCHNRQFLFKNSETRIEWLSRLKVGVERFQIAVLDYIVTCNHIHLLVQDSSIPNAIAKCMQLTQGCFAQDFNAEQQRKNAFWGDRYHATAIESGVHLLRCIAYIDLNMVRAGVVSHPNDWKESGFCEIEGDKFRNRIINLHRLCALLDAPDMVSLQKKHGEIINNIINNNQIVRDERWTTSIAVGSRQFVDIFSANLGKRVGNKKPQELSDEQFMLREPKTEVYGNEVSKSCFLEGNNQVKLLNLSD